MKKYEYKSERIELVRGWQPILATDYMNVIDSHAEKGWRFVQAFAPGLSMHGRAQYADLIFEREISMEE